MTKHKIKIKKIIRELDTKTHKNLALAVWVDIIGTNSRGAKHIETLQVGLGKPSDDQFTPYENLTEEQVKQWVIDQLNNTPQSQFDDQADKQLTRMQHIEQTIDLRLQEIQLMSDFLPWENRPEENDEKNYSENQ